MLASGVHHLSFTVKNLERAKAFYEGVLGLETIERPEMGIGGVWYTAGNAQVHLIEVPGKPDTEDDESEPSLSPLANHNAFAIDDYAKVRDFLTERGIKVLETSPQRGQMWINDPDGNVLEFIAPPAP